TRVFAPRSIAVIGASDTATKIGGVPVDFNQRFGFAGPIYPVNPRPGRIQGLQSYPDMRSIGQPVDVAVIAVPQPLVQAALEDAIAAGVRGVVLFTSGYAEVSADGAQAQARLQETARSAGVRLLGPNCLGYMNLRSSVYATFCPVPGGGRVRPGHIGLVSQSGAFGGYAYALARERDIGFSQWITTGNEADLELADGLEWLAHDPQTHVIMGYMEGCRDGRKLRRALAAAHAARKPVVLVKVGRTDAGAQAAASHTAALAGNDAAYDAVFRAYGVHRARDITEFFDIAASACVAGLPRDRSAGLFTVSGGVGVLMADEAADAGLDVRPMPMAAQDEIRRWVPFAGAANPVDITGQVSNDQGLIERTVRLMLEQGHYASLVGFVSASGLTDRSWPMLQSLAALLQRDYPGTVYALCTLMSAERRRTLQDLGCLVYSEPADAVRAVAALVRFAESFGRTLPTAPPAGPPRRPLSAGNLSEPQALALLAAAGIRTVPHEVVQSAADAAAAAQRLGGAVVLKVVSPDILHKSDIGGVALGLRDGPAVQAAFDAMQQAVQRSAPQARIDGVLVAPMLAGGVECILGAHRDPVFGPMVMFGLGGIFVELLGDVALHTAPVNTDQAMQMIRSTRGFGLLAGARGREPVDLDTLAANLVALSELAADAGDTLDSIDINPFMALPARLGGGCALDTVVVGRADPSP
ncbi:MAG: acetate--CoA ligase family protein, partial [Aquabacterium sp.]